MKPLYSAVAIAAVTFCHAGFAGVESAKDQGTVLRELCQQVVQDIDRQMGRKVAFCMPAASVQNGEPDLLMIVSRAHFAGEETRSKWVGLSIVTAAQAAKLPSGNQPPLKALMIDQADKERKSLDDLTLCTVPIKEAATLSQRAGSDFGDVYKNSSCHRAAATNNTANK